MTFEGISHLKHISTTHSLSSGTLAHAVSIKTLAMHTFASCILVTPALDSAVCYVSTAACATVRMSEQTFYSKWKLRHLTIFLLIIFTQ